MSQLEADLAWQLMVSDFKQGMTREYQFHDTRKWRFDFAWPANKLAVEVQGGLWLGKKGGHTSARGRERDCEKANAAVLDGWRVLQVTAGMIKSGEALNAIETALAGSVGNGDSRGAIDQRCRCRPILEA